MNNLVSLNWYNKIAKLPNVDYIDDMIYILDKQPCPDLDRHPFKTDVTVCLICTRGEADVRIEMTDYHIKAPCLCTILPNMIVEYIRSSEDFQCQVILISRRFSNELNVSINISDIISLKNNPCTRVDRNVIAIMQGYVKILQATIRADENSINRLEIIKHISIALMYGLEAFLRKPVVNKKHSRNDAITHNFLELVQKNFKDQRMLDFYANKMCLTAKYLSKVIKDSTGKSASDWIEDFVVLEAKALLKSTDMTIQQISDELNFHTQSFFGKYFKRLVGVSPRQYRNGNF